MTQRQSSLILVVILLFLNMMVFQYAYAHPGNTASDGCHYCRTNCDKWGEEWNARHCHNSKTPNVTSNSDNKISKQGFIEEHPIISLGGAWVLFYAIGQAWKTIEERRSRN